MEYVSRSPTSTMSGPMMLGTTSRPRIFHCGTAYICEAST